jgi:hypothetical protein
MVEAAAVGLFCVANLRHRTKMESAVFIERILPQLSLSIAHVPRRL